MSLVAVNGRKAGWPQGIALLLASMLPAMGVVLLTPNLPALNARFGNVPGGQYLVSMALTMPGLCIALLSPFAGLVVDRYGRCKALYAGLILYGVFGMAPLFLDTLPAIIVSRMGVGVVEAVILTAIFALLGDYFHDVERNRWLAYNGSFTALAATCFYLIGGVLGSYGWRLPFVMYGISILIFLLGRFVLWEPARKARGNAADTHLPTGLLSLAFIAVCFVTVFSSVLFYVIPLEMGVFLEAREAISPAVVGTLIAIASIGNPIGALAFKYLSDWKPARLLTVSYAVSGLGLIAMALSTSFPQIAVAAFINQLGCGMFIPVLMSSAMNALPAHSRGRGGGIYTTAFFLGQFLCPLILIALTGSMGTIGHAFIGFGVISLIAAFVALLVLQQRRRALIAV
jgi:MFS family permease